jgi:[acyl-carrier-protein] S-malonyltransferase
MNHMKSEGVSVIVECGPGKVLAGLIKRIDRALSTSCIDTSDALQKSLDGAA